MYCIYLIPEHWIAVLYGIYTPSVPFKVRCESGICLHCIKLSPNFYALKILLSVNFICKSNPLQDYNFHMFISRYVPLKEQSNKNQHNTVVLCFNAMVTNYVVC